MNITETYQGPCELFANTASRPMFHHKSLIGSCICLCMLQSMFFCPRKNASFGIFISNSTHKTFLFGKKPWPCDMSYKLSCLKFSLLTVKAATFLSVPFGVVIFGDKDPFQIFVYPFPVYIAERWYLLKKGIVIEEFLR